MMKILMKTTLLVSLLAIGLGTAFASTTDELMLTVGGLTATITDNGGCAGTGCTGLVGDVQPSAGATEVLGTIGGWTIVAVVGTTFSPIDVPEGLGLVALTATCAALSPCTADPLDVLYSDIGFSPANPAFESGFSATIGGTGSASQSAYYSNSNTLFAETNQIGTTLGPITSTSLGLTTSGGVGSVAPYSLTLEETFADTSAGAVSFQTGGNVSSVPEPGAVILFGTVLALCSSKLRRRRAS